MAYQITKGILESELPRWLKKAAKKYGTFPDGRVDYTDSKIAPIVMCTIVYDDKLLLVKRGYGLADAEGYWSTVNGFVDEIRPLNEAAAQELIEELTLKIEPSDIKVGASYTLKGMKERRTYIVFPCLLVLKSKPKIKLNSENTGFRWIRRSELQSFHILDDLPVAVDAALELA